MLMVIGVSSCYRNIGVTTSVCRGKVENQCLVVFVFSNFSRDTEVRIREKKTFRTRKSESFLTSVRIRTSEPKSGILPVRTNPRIKVREHLFGTPTSGGLFGKARFFNFVFFALALPLPQYLPR